MQCKLQLATTYKVGDNMSGNEISYAGGKDEKYKASYCYLDGLASIMDCGILRRVDSLIHVLETGGDVKNTIRYLLKEIEYKYVLECIGDISEEDDPNKYGTLMEEVAEVGRIGAIKHGRFNYKLSTDASVFTEALCRHAIAVCYYQKPYDPEDGLTHYAHMASNLLILAATLHKV